MRPGFLLHLGMAKAGSTAIQEALAGYRDGAWEYLDLGEPNHSATLGLALLEAPPRRLYRSGEAGAQAAEREAARGRLLAALPGERGAILSGEELSVAFRTREACEGVAALLRGHARVVRGLAYVRDPASFARSQFQQRLRLEAVRLDVGRLLPFYRRRFRPWVGALGEEGLALVDYGRAAGGPGGLVADLAARAGLERVPPARGRPNASLSAEAVAVLFALRREDGAPPLHGPGRAANARLLEMLSGFGRGRLGFGPGLMERGLLRQANDLRWAERRIGTALARLEAGADVVVEGEGDLLDLAAGAAPALAEWVEARGLGRAAAGEGAAAVLRGAARRLGEAPAPGGRLARRVVGWLRRG